MSMMMSLTRPYAARSGAPILTRVDPRIFELRYFTRCMACDFCDDACCRHGVDVDEPTVHRILARADAIERDIGVPRSEWFEPGFVADAEHPGGRYTRTRVRAGRCVFRVPSRRGCSLHAHALASGLDYHEIKPLVSALFPLTFDEGVLHPATEALGNGTLVCVGEGSTLYRGVRDEIAYYFGEVLVLELDSVESRLGAFA